MLTDLLALFYILLSWAINHSELEYTALLGSPL